jgi:hypothetical protein
MHGLQWDYSFPRSPLDTECSYRNMGGAQESDVYWIVKIFITYYNSEANLIRYFLVLEMLGQISRQPKLLHKDSLPKRFV